MSLMACLPSVVTSQQNACYPPIMKAYSPGLTTINPFYGGRPTQGPLFSPDQLRITRSLRKSMRNRGYRVTFDTAFSAVISACQCTPRSDQNGTWITEEMVDAYTQLHYLGHAHSVECWHEEQLVGGLYGLSIGKLFFGESMFSIKTDASKVAFVTLAQRLQKAGFP